MNKTILVIGSSGVVGNILCKKIIEAGFDVLTLSRPEPGQKLFDQNCGSYDMIVNLAYGLSDEEYQYLENFSGPVLDMTAKYRTNSQWMYGLPNLPGYAEKITAHKRVSNPGCFSQAGILLLYPLVAEAILDSNCFLSLQAIGGFSSAGKPAYALVEKNDYHSHVHSLVNPHPHKEEIKTHSKYNGIFDFTPISAEFERGTFVKIAIPQSLAIQSEIEYIYRKYYSNSDIVLKPFPPKLALDSQAGMEGAIIYYGELQGVSTVAIHFDNLLKGAASTALHNINKMLDSD